jgi:predicted metal-binding membrane protein
VRTANDRALLGLCALLFAATAAVTAFWCTSMTVIGMPMPGGWTMSTAWMRMPGQTWLGAATSFLLMWMVMMVAMMLPSLVPMLRRYREAVDTTQRRGRLTVLVAVGYFLVWAVIGITAFSIGIALASVEMRNPALARAVPMAIGGIVIAVGATQFTRWKAHHLACCRATLIRCGTLPPDPGTAWRHGVGLGLHCAQACGGPIVSLLVIGVMDLRAMLAIGCAITAERLAPAGERVARTVGAVMVCVGLALIVRAVGQLA